MIINNPKFEISAVSEKQYPKGDKPEIVLVRKIKCWQIFFCKYNGK